MLALGGGLPAHQHRVLPDEDDIPPGDDEVRLSAQQAEQPQLSVDHHGGEAGLLGVHLHVAHKSDAAPVLDIDDLLVPQGIHPANHSRHLLPVFYAERRRSIPSLLGEGMV